MEATHPEVARLSFEGGDQRPPQAMPAAIGMKVMTPKNISKAMTAMIAPSWFWTKNVPESVRSIDDDLTAGGEHRAGAVGSAADAYSGVRCAAPQHRERARQIHG